MMPIHSTPYEQRRAAQRAFGDPHGDRGPSPDVVGPGASSAADETPAAHVPGSVEMASRCLSCGVPLSTNDLKTEPNCQACADGAGATHTAGPSPDAPATEPGQHVVSSEAIAFGGPGSGWHAEQGHVPGSQGGGNKTPSGFTKTAHDLAMDAHLNAARAHERAARAHTAAARVGIEGPPGLEGKASTQRTAVANRLTRKADALSGTPDAVRHAASAINRFKNRLQSPSKAERVQMHKAAARSHAKAAQHHVDEVQRLRR